MGTRESLHYGAVDLKRVYNRNLGTALVLSIAFHAGIVALYLLCVNIGRAEPITIDGDHPRTVIDYVHPPAPAPPGGTSGGGRSLMGNGMLRARSIGGMPIASDDTSLIAAMTPDIMTPGGDLPAGAEISMGGGSTCTLRNDTGRSFAPLMETPKHHPDMEEFVSVEKEPVWDPADLQRHITYPDIAARNNIQGLVVVRVLIDEDGRVADMHVDRSDNSMLTDAALDAIRQTRFTAAIQNKIPTAVWVQIPVTFKLN
ncbi:MAG: outer rane transport energization protein TonB [Chlorobi bacterium]|nr:outer rane transport energization protein TonB [Chlorobiota bacterium]